MVDCEFSERPQRPAKEPYCRMARNGMGSALCGTGNANRPHEITGALAGHRRDKEKPGYGAQVPTSGLHDRKACGYSGNGRRRIE
jgi:hypothetical protein